MKVELSKEELQNLMQATYVAVQAQHGDILAYPKEYEAKFAKLSDKFEAALAQMDGKLNEDDLETIEQALLDAIAVTDEMIEKWSQPRIGLNTYELVKSKTALRRKYLALWEKLEK